MDSPSVTSIDQQPTGPDVNRPDSGTYGENAALERLQSALPGVDASSPAAGPQAGSPGGGQPGPAPVPPTAGGPAGPPAALFAPTNNPDVPVSTPLQQAPSMPTSEPAQRLLAWQYLAQHGTTDDVRQHAQLVVNKLIRLARA